MGKQYSKDSVLEILKESNTLDEKIVELDNLLSEVGNKKIDIRGVILFLTNDNPFNVKHSPIIYSILGQYISAGRLTTIEELTLIILSSEKLNQKVKSLIIPCYHYPLIVSIVLGALTLHLIAAFFPKVGLALTLLIAGMLLANFKHKDTSVGAAVESILKKKK